MSKYYLDGFTPPKDVTGHEKVKEYQRQLGVTVDGIWGPKTQAAYDKVYNSTISGKPSSNINSNTFLNYYNSILSNMTIPTIKVDTPSKEELTADISSFLRPAYDTAITKRKKTEKNNLAEIDADAVSRGMGSSSFVSSLKSRERNNTQEDIISYETDYASTLAKKVYDAMTAYKELTLEAEKFNAQAKQSASDTAFSAAQSIYKTFLETEAAAAKSNSSSSNSSSSSSNKNTSFAEDEPSSPALLSYSDCILYLSSLSKGELKNLTSSTTQYWKDIRGQLMDSLGEDNYQRLLGRNGQFYYDR